MLIREDAEGAFSEKNVLQKIFRFFVWLRLRLRGIFCFPLKFVNAAYQFLERQNVFWGQYLLIKYDFSK